VGVGPSSEKTAAGVVKRNLEQPQKKKKREEKRWGSGGKKNDRNDQEASFRLSRLSWAASKNFVWVLLPWVDSM